tara:strand:+ start:67 stop:288 length:222 start_codon:yes stop_codon:yes gene_type:complete
VPERLDFFSTEFITKSSSFTPYFDNGSSLSNQTIVIISSVTKKIQKKYFNPTQLKKTIFIIAGFINDKYKTIF